MKSEYAPGSVFDDPTDGELDLVRAVTAGSVQAWHTFLERYSGLIYGVLRRHLFSVDEDDVRSVLVEVLNALYRGGLSKYRGESRLSSWLIVTTRCHAVDYWRKRQGRRRLPRHYGQLDDFDRKVLRLYYVERLPLEVVVHTLAWRNGRVGVNDVVESIQRIEETLGARYLNQLEREYQAARLGIRPTRLLRYMIAQRVEYESQAKSVEADAYTIEKEALETAERVRAVVSKFSPEERMICAMRFENGWSARRIAEKLESGGQRRVYTVINRVLRKLRRSLAVEADTER